MTRVQGNDSRWDAWLKQTSRTGRPPAPKTDAAPAKPDDGGAKKGKSAAAAARLRQRSEGGADTRRLDRLVQVFKRHGRLPERFLDGAEGRACLRQLGRQSDGAVASQLRQRGLSHEQVQTVRGELFVHLQRRVGSTLCDAVADARTVVSRMLRDPAVRAGFRDHLSSLSSDRARSQTLQSLGIEAGRADALARDPRGAGGSLRTALTETDEGLQRLWTQATMTRVDTVRAAGTFETFGPVVDKVRRDLGLPAGNGSFGSQALDDGVKAAARSKRREENYGKASGVAATVVATIITGGAYGLGVAAAMGTIGSGTTSAITGLPGLAKARHSRKLTETGEALGLTQRGAAERARREERSTKRQYGAGVALSATAGAGGAAVAGAGTVMGLAVGAETVNQTVVPGLVR